MQRFDADKLWEKRRKFLVKPLCLNFGTWFSVEETGTSQIQGAYVSQRPGRVWRLELSELVAVLFATKVRLRIAEDM